MKCFISALLSFSVLSFGCRTRIFNKETKSVLDSSQNMNSSRPKPAPSFVLGVPIIEFSSKSGSTVQLVTKNGLVAIDGARVKQFNKYPSGNGYIQDAPPTYEASFGARKLNSFFLDGWSKLSRVLPTISAFENCNELSGFLGGFEILEDQNVKCFLHVGGADEEARFVLTPLGPNGEGFVSMGAAKDALQYGDLHPYIGMSKPQDANAQMGPGAPNMVPDSQQVKPVIVKMANQFSVQTKDTRELCLNNPMLGAWTDLGVHTYCFLPIKTRVCYSGQLIETRKALLEGAFKILDADAPAQRIAKSVEATLNAHRTAFESCLVPGTQNTDKGTAVFFATEPAVAAAFKYAIWTVPGFRDYNIELEHQLIAEFNSELRYSMKRRPSDSFPNWAPDQPRLIELRKLQGGSMIKSGVASNAPDTNRSPSSSAPSALPQSGSSIKPRRIKVSCDFGIINYTLFPLDLQYTSQDVEMRISMPNHLGKSTNQTVDAKKMDASLFQWTHNRIFHSLQLTSDVSATLTKYPFADQLKTETAQCVVASF